MRTLVQRAWEKTQRDGLRDTVAAASRRATQPANRWITAQLVDDIVSTRGVTLDLSGANVSDHMNVEIVQGVYESEEVSAICEYLQPEMDVVDLGGCLGFTACYANERIDDSSTHVVVEPNPALEPVLQRNRELNDCDFKIFHGAYSNNEGPVTLEIPEDIWGASLDRNGETVVTVGAVTLQMLIDRFDLSQIALIVDIEGAEADLLTNELDVLEQYCRVLIIEFHDQKEVYEHLGANISAARDKLADSCFECIDETASGVGVYRNTAHIIE